MDRTLLTTLSLTDQQARPLAVAGVSVALGAGAGCIIGRHEAKKHAREHERAYEEGYGNSGPSYDHGYGYGPR